jgi:hypothetical protein
MQDEIKSPFQNFKSENEFYLDVQKLIKKYGYNKFFIIYSEPEDHIHELWRASSNYISEEMSDYLEECRDFIKQELEGML